jgi:hypothetical protein
MIEENDMIEKDSLSRLLAIVNKKSAPNPPIIISTPEQADSIFGKLDEIRAIRRCYKRRKAIDEFLNSNDTELYGIY